MRAPTFNFTFGKKKDEDEPSATAAAAAPAAATSPATPAPAPHRGVAFAAPPSVMGGGGGRGAAGGAAAAMSASELVSQRQLPLDDTVLLKLLLRSILYGVPWSKPEEERLSDGIYNPDEKLEVAKTMLPCLDLAVYDAAVEVVRAEDPIVSLKVLFNEANQFRNMQIAPPEPYYEPGNWRDPERRNRRIKDFYAEVKRRSEWRFQDDTAKKEDAWKVWNFVQSGEAMRKPPAKDDIVRANEQHSNEPAADNSDDDGEDDDDDGQNGIKSGSGTLAAALMGLNSTNTVSGLSGSSMPDDQAQFVGGQLSSCFGGDLILRVHALRWTGRPDPKAAAALPARTSASFVFCINTRPQWDADTPLQGMPTRQLMTPNSVIDYDAALEQRGMLASPTQENWNRNSNLAELVHGTADKTKRQREEEERGKKRLREPKLDEHGLPILEASDPTSPSSSIPVRDVRAPKMPDGADAAAAAASSSSPKKPQSESSYYWDFREELFHLPFGDVPIRLDVSDLAFSVRTPPGCCGFTGSDEVCTLRIPLSSLYIDVLALNSVNRKRRFRAQGADGVHCVFKWYDCTVAPKFAKQNPGLASSGTFSLCVSMHLRCRCRSHNRPLYAWNPFADPQFDVHKGQCRVNTDIEAMQQVWQEPLHRYFIHLIENFHPRREDLELNVIEQFHDMYCLDPQFLFVWTLRTELFAGKLHVPEDRTSIRAAATHLAGLAENASQLNTHEAEKFVLDTKKHAVARFLSVPGSLEELFGGAGDSDERIIQANEGLALAVHVLRIFGVDDIEQSIAEAAKRDVAAFFVVASDSIAEIAKRFAAHCQDVLKDFSLCFQHMKKAIKFGQRVKKIEEKIEKQRAAALAANAQSSPLSPAAKKKQQQQQQQQNGGEKLTCSRVIKIRMQTMAEDVCRRLRLAVSHIHVAGANSATVGRPEAISPLMQLVTAATDCGDQLGTIGLDVVGHELEGIVPQTFLPMFLSLARERLHSLVRSIVRAFPLEPSQPGRVQSTPAAADAFQFIRATFDEFVEVARACDIETVLICLGSLLNYLIEATDVFVSELSGWGKELDETSNPVDGDLEATDRAGKCLARFEQALVTFERALTLHATLCSFHRLLDDFWGDDTTRDFIENLDAAISHINETARKEKEERQRKAAAAAGGNKKQSAMATAAAAAMGGGGGGGRNSADDDKDGAAGSLEESEHQVFQAKTSMVETLNNHVLPLEIAMLDRVMPAALRLPHDFAVWARSDVTHAVRTESELNDQQADIAGAAASCLRRIFRAIVHRADRSVLRSRLCMVAVRGIVTNLVNCLVLDGDMMTAQNDLNLRLQRGIMSHVVHTAREEIEAMCDAAGGAAMWQTAAPLVAELDTALGIGLMSSTQLCAMLAHLRVTPQEQWDREQNGTSGGGNGKAGHRRQVSGAGRINISRDRYERLLKRACVARALLGDEACKDYAADVHLEEYEAALTSTPPAGAIKK